MIVKYSTSTLSNVEVVRWDQIPVYDLSGVNVLYDQHDFTVRFWLTETSADNLRKAFNVIRQNLNKPRQALLIAPDSYPTTSAFIDAFAVAGDLTTGPKPQELRIVQFIGNQAIQLEWRVTFTWLDCYSTDGANHQPHEDVVISKSISATHRMDVQGLMTRIFNCTLRVRDGRPGTVGLARNISAMTKARIRGSIPPLDDGYIRRGVDIGLSTDGLEISVQTVDQEINDPGVLTGIAQVLAADYQEGFVLPMGNSATPFGMFRKSINLMFQGVKGFPKTRIIDDIIIPLVESKFAFVNIQESPQDQAADDDYVFQGEEQYEDLPLSITWRQSLVDNIVGVQISAVSFPRDNNFGLWDENTGAAFFLSNKFLQDRLPDSVRIVSQPGNSSAGVDFVTWKPQQESVTDRFDDFPLITRLIIDDICTHQFLTSNLNRSTVDDLPAVFTFNVAETHVGSEEDLNIQSDLLSEHASVRTGGYLVDQEHVKFEIIGDTTVFSPTVGTDVTAQKQLAITNRAPTVKIVQAGIAARVNARANPRNMIKFQGAGLVITPRQLVHDVQIRPIQKLGNANIHVTTWHYVYEWPNLGAGYFEENPDTGELVIKPKRIKQQKSRVWKQDHQDVSLYLSQWNTSAQNNNIQ